MLFGEPEGIPNGYAPWPEGPLWVKGGRSAQASQTSALRQKRTLDIVKRDKDLEGQELTQWRKSTLLPL